MNSVVLIPARMEATRFPGKPLAQIHGRPMIEWVFEAVSESDATAVFVITDSDEIINAVEAFGGAYIKTSSQPVNGTERCHEAIEILAADGKEFDVVINVQGDEPLIDPQDINKLLDLFESEEIDIATLLSPITQQADYLSTNVVKATTSVFDEGYCDIHYFSRSPIPYMEEFKANVAFKHIGVYGFTATAFDETTNLGTAELEHYERLEQLRWLQNHLIISGIVTTNEMVGVDSPDDIISVENILKSKS